MTGAKEVGVRVGRVYYPEGVADRDLYVSRRNKSAWRVNPRGAGRRSLTAPRVCGRRCLGTSRSTGRRCKRKTCMDYRYCAQHLAREKHLVVAPSRRLRELGARGYGLYACNPDLGALRRGPGGVPEPDGARRRVFARGVRMDVYGGERMSKADFDRRYNDPNDRDTSSYGMGGTGFIVDGLAAATAVSYANESVDVAALMRRSNSYRAFKEAYERKSDSDGRANAAITQHANVLWMVSTKPIFQGQEILWHYGPGYWGTPGMKSHLTGSGWS